MTTDEQDALDLDAARRREGESLALLSDLGPQEAAGLAASAALGRKFIGG